MTQLELIADRNDIARVIDPSATWIGDDVLAKADAIIALLPGPTEMLREAIALLEAAQCEYPSGERSAAWHQRRRRIIEAVNPPRNRRRSFAEPLSATDRDAADPVRKALAQFDETLQKWPYPHVITKVDLDLIRTANAAIRGDAQIMKASSMLPPKTTETDNG